MEQISAFVSRSLLSERQQFVARRQNQCADEQFNFPKPMDPHMALPDRSRETRLWSSTPERAADENCRSQGCREKGCITPASRDTT